MPDENLHDPQIDGTGEFVHFERVGPSATGKTLIWAVVNPSDDQGASVPLGLISWFGRWRKYAFHPRPDTVYEHVCLRDIADFCEERTRLHRDALKAQAESRADD